MCTIDKITFSVGGKVRYPSKLEEFSCSDFNSAADTDSDALDEGATRSMRIAELAL